MARRLLELAAAIGTGLLGILIGLAVFGQASSPALAASCSVPSVGYATIQAALSDLACDTISVAAGSYTTNLVITRSLTLSGAGASSTTIDGGGAGVVISIGNGARPTIEGFTIRGGDGTVSGGKGGGIAIQQASAVIRNNTIVDNVASQNILQQGWGGGIYVLSSTQSVSIMGNTIQTNTAFLVPAASVVGPDGGGCGGGIAIGPGSSADIIANTVGWNLAATAVWTNTAPLQVKPEAKTCGGGGIYFKGEQVTINGNLIQHNVATQVGNSGQGGGIDLMGKVASVNLNTIVENTALVSGTVMNNEAGGQGGGINGLGDFQSITILSNTIEHNTAMLDGVGLNLALPMVLGGGGGIHVNGAAGTIPGTFEPIPPGRSVTIRGNSVNFNTAINNLSWSAGFIAGGGGAGGGGIFVVRVATTNVENNQIKGNVSVRNARMNLGPNQQNPFMTFGGAQGGGMTFQMDGDLTVSGNVVQDNMAAEEAVAENVNVSHNGGGMSLYKTQRATISNNTFTGNTAVVTVTVNASITGTNYFARGGGVSVADVDVPDPEGPPVPNDSVTLINNTIANNVAARAFIANGTTFFGSAIGGGLYVQNITSTQIISNVVRDNLGVQQQVVAPAPALSQGGGIAIVKGDSATISDNTLSGNLAVLGGGSTLPGSQAQGGGIFVQGPPAVIRNNTVATNVASKDVQKAGRGGGIYVASTGAPAQIYANTIRANTAFSVPMTSLVVEGKGGGCGGGIGVGFGSAAVITGNTVRGNVGFTRGDSSSFPFSGLTCGGGGIWTQGDTTTIDGNTVEDNFAGFEGNLGQGGGIDVTGRLATVSNNTVVRNTSIISGPLGQGGGINGTGFFQAITVTNNVVMTNTGMVTGTSSLPTPFISAGGGGVHVFGMLNKANDRVFVKGNRLVGNVLAKNIIGRGSAGTVAGAGGGGAYLVQIGQVDFLDNEVVGNTAVEDISLNGNGAFGGGQGGGLVLHGIITATASSNVLRDNVAVKKEVLGEGAISDADGGGISVWRTVNATLRNNTVTRNTALVSATAGATPPLLYFARGGGIYVADRDVPDFDGPPVLGENFIIEGNHIANNVAAVSLNVPTMLGPGTALGGGIMVWNISTTQIISNVVQDNLAGRDKTANGWAEGGGIALVGASTVSMQRNLVQRNQPYATAGDGWAGCAVAWGSNLSSVNDVLARNGGGVGARDNMLADGTSVPSRVSITNDTLYANAAMGAEARNTSALLVTNTIIFSHTTGLVRENITTTVAENYNLLTNASNYGGSPISKGAQTYLDQDAGFVDGAANNFHLASGSGGIDRGSKAAAPAIDFDGLTRGVVPEIGAFEFFGPYLVHIPFVLKGVTAGW